MAYLIDVLFPGLLAALALGVLAGWELQRARSRPRLQELERVRSDQLSALIELTHDGRALQEARLAAEFAQAELARLQGSYATLEAERGRSFEEIRRLAEARTAAEHQTQEARARAQEEQQRLTTQTLGLIAERDRLRAALQERGPQDETRVKALEERVARLSRPDLRARYRAARLAWAEGRRDRLAARIEAERARLSRLEEGAAEAAGLREERARLVWRSRYLARRAAQLEPRAFAPAQSPDLGRREQFLEARARFLQGAVARLRPLRAEVKRLTAALVDALGERDRAVRALEEAHAQRPAPAAEAATALVTGFGSDLSSWTSSAQGPPAEAPPPAGWSIVALDGAGVAQANGGFRELRPKRPVQLHAGRRYRLKARVRQLVDAKNGGGQTAGLDAYPSLGERFEALPAAATPRLLEVDGKPRAAALTAADGWVEFEAILAADGGAAVWARPRLFVNWKGDRAVAGDGVVQVAEFSIEEIANEEGAAYPPLMPGAAAAPAMRRPRAPLRRSLGKNWRAQYRVKSPPPPPRSPPPEPEAPPRRREPPQPTGPRRPPERLGAPRGGLPDDLRRLPGVDAALQRTLNDTGIFHFDQIAAWTTENVAWVDRHLSLRGRIEADRWVGVARVLAGLDADAA